jgi:CBS domain-containing protein
MQVKDVMNKPAVTCPETACLDHPARLMWEFDCGVIPVVDAAGKPGGIITDRDICMAAYTQGRPLADIPVTTAMARAVIATHTGEPIERAEQLMREHQVRRLPVLDGDASVVGVVSLNDLARLAARAHRSAVDREVVQTLAEVCRPRLVAPPADGSARPVRQLVTV